MYILVWYIQISKLMYEPACVFSFFDLFFVFFFVYTFVCCPTRWSCMHVCMLHEDLETDAATNILTHKHACFFCIRICTYALCIGVYVVGHVVGHVCHVHTYTSCIHISKSTQPRTCSHILIFGTHVSMSLDSLMRFIAKLTQPHTYLHVCTHVFLVPTLVYRQKCWLCIYVCMLHEYRESDPATNILTRMYLCVFCVHIRTYVVCRRLCAVGPGRHVHTYVCCIRMSKSTQPRTRWYMIQYHIPARN